MVVVLRSVLLAAASFEGCLLAEAIACEAAPLFDGHVQKLHQWHTAT